MENQEGDKGPMSREIQWFVHTLKDDFQVIAAKEDIVVEATELGLDEVEEFFVPS